MPQSPPRSPSSPAGTPASAPSGADRDFELRHDDRFFTDADELDASSEGRPADLVFVAAERGAAHAGQSKVQSLDEMREGMIVSTESSGARLVSLAEGRADRPMTVTIHGINASPDTVRSLSGRAAAAGDAVKTLVYDDRGQSLETTSQSLASSLGQWLGENPGRTLRVDAHSMGGRVALRALDLLSQKGKLRGRKVQLNLIASPINGVAAATALHFAPPIIGDIVRSVLGASSSDVAPISDFQSKLDAVRFAENVQVRVFTAGNDSVVSADADFERLAGKLNAVRVRFANADHDTAVDMAAAWLDRND